MDLYSLVGHIYDCIDHPEEWEGVLGVISRQLDCSVAAMMSHSLVDGSIKFHVKPFGLDNNSVKVYEKLHQSNPWLEANLDFVLNSPRSEIQNALMVGELVTEQELITSDTYKNFLKPADMNDVVSLPAIAGERLSGFAFFCGGRRKKKFSSKEKSFLKYLSTHVYRASKLAEGKFIENYSSEILCRKTYDAAIFLSSNGYIVSDENQGLKKLSKWKVATTINRKLIFLNASTQAKFQQCMRQLKESANKEVTKFSDNGFAGELVSIGEVDPMDKRGFGSCVYFVLLLNVYIHEKK